MLARGVAVACLLAACGDNVDKLAWGVGVTTFDAVALGLTSGGGDDPPIVPHERIGLPTYDRSDQAVHPDVLREQNRYVLAFTPYPYSDNRFENPSIAVSDDGIAFAEPAPGVNPLVPAPPIDHNDDPDLRINASGEYEVLYLETERPDVQRLVALDSTDLVTWTRRDVITYDLAAGDPFVVSPSVAGASLFDVHLGDPNFIERIESAPWTPADARPIALDLGGVTPWHADAFATPNGYAMLINGYTEEFAQQDLYLATTPEMSVWHLRPEPLLAHDDPALDVVSLYRATGLVIGSKLVVWYSYQYAQH